jgi:hypothetical protein
LGWPECTPKTCTDRHIEHLRRTARIDGSEGAAQTQFVAQQRGNGLGVAVAANEAQQPE